MEQYELSEAESAEGRGRTTNFAEDETHSEAVSEVLANIVNLCDTQQTRLGELRSSDDPSTSNFVVNAPFTSEMENADSAVKTSLENQIEYNEHGLAPLESTETKQLENLQEAGQEKINSDSVMLSEIDKVNEVTPKTEVASPKLENEEMSESIDNSHEPPKLMSPEPNCSICLGKMENKSFTNSCFHQFCFTCLLEWSKVKPECPLCKQPFKSIVHNVRSMEDYDQYYLRFENINSWDSPNGRRFRYRSTLTAERRREITLGRFLRSHSHRYSDDSLDSRLLPSSHPLASTSDYRRFVYEQNLWAQTMRSVRFRECGPTFYSQNPACTHRLIPWINRELNALQYGHQVAFLMELILSLILRFHIQSPEFEELVRPYFLSNTSHFIHEFHSFARSPLDMTEYDRRVTYRERINEVSSSSTDNDVIYLQSMPGSSRPRWSRRQLPTVLPLQPLTVDSDNSVINRARDFLQSVSMLSTSTSAGSPQPGPSGLQTIVLATGTSHPGSFGNSSCSQSDTSDDDSIEVLPQDLSSPRVCVSRVIKTEVVIPDEEADDDDCIFIGYEKPPMQRSPMAIIVISDSEDDVSVTATAGGNRSDEPSTSASRAADVGGSSGISSSASTSTEPSSSTQRNHFHGENTSHLISPPKSSGHLSSVICRPTKRTKHRSHKRSNSRSRSRHSTGSSAAKKVKHHKRHSSRQSRSRHDSCVSPSSSTHESRKRLIIR